MFCFRALSRMEENRVSFAPMADTPLQGPRRWKQKRRKTQWLPLFFPLFYGSAPLHDSCNSCNDIPETAAYVRKLLSLCQNPIFSEEYFAISKGVELVHVNDYTPLRIFEYSRTGELYSIWTISITEISICFIVP